MRMLEEPLAMTQAENQERLRQLKRSERKSIYTPHEGKREIERRRRQEAKKAARVAM